MKVGLVSQWFPPEGAWIAEAWAVELSRLGHEVHVVTGFPNYPSGKVFDGYKIKLYEKHEHRGVTVHRGPLYPSHDSNPIKRFANYFSFAIGSVLTAFRVPPVDIWLTNCTPATAATAAMVQRLTRNTPSLTVVQDLWPDSVLDSDFLPLWADRVVRPILNTYCRAIYRLSDTVGVISPSMIGILEQRGVPESKIRYMPNGIPDTNLGPSGSARGELRSRLGLPEGRLFMYAGNIGPLQNLSALVDAFRQVPSAQLVIIGAGVSESEVRSRAEGASNVHFIGRIPSSEIGQYIESSDVQVVSLADSRMLRVTMPSKMQTAFAAGKPILAHAAGDVAAVVDQTGVGFSASPSDSKEAATIISSFVEIDSSQLQEMGERARKVYEERYSIEVMVKTLESALETAIKSRVEIRR